MGARKILFYIHSLAGGGAERVFALLASELASRGHEVILVNDFSASQNKIFLDKSVRIITIGRGRIRPIARLITILRRERPDIVFSALGSANLKITVANIFAGRPSALVLTYHGRFSSEEHLFSRLGYILTPLLARLADHTISVSADLANYITRTWHADHKRTTFIHNPVLIANADQIMNAKPLSERADIILAVGRLCAEKDFLSLIRAFARIRRPTARLIILGEGPDRSLLEAEINRLGLNGRVDLPGYVDTPWLYFEQAKCFALTSKSEGFGNVIVEAMSYGLSIVSTTCGGPQEILEHGRYGALVPVGDIDAIATQLNSALENPGNSQVRFDRAADFSIPVVTTQYETLIESILG